MVMKLLTYNPDERPTAREALQHPWINKYAEQDKVDKVLAKKTLQNL